MTFADLENLKNFLQSDFDEFWSYDILLSELSSSNSRYIVAKNKDNTIVGFAAKKIILDEAELMNIVVNKASRHSGIGTLLLNKLLEICKEKNLDSIFLEVNEKNLNAQKLYKNFGFETISIRKNYYNSDNGIVMKKFLRHFNN